MSWLGLLLAWVNLPGMKPDAAASTWKLNRDLVLGVTDANYQANFGLVT